MMHQRNNGFGGGNHRPMNGNGPFDHRNGWGGPQNAPFNQNPQNFSGNGFNQSGPSMGGRQNGAGGGGINDNSSKTTTQVTIPKDVRWTHFD